MKHLSLAPSNFDAIVSLVTSVDAAKFSVASVPPRIRGFVRRYTQKESTFIAGGYNDPDNTAEIIAYCLAPYSPASEDHAPIHLFGETKTSLIDWRLTLTKFRELLRTSSFLCEVRKNQILACLDSSNELSP